MLVNYMKERGQTAMSKAVLISIQPKWCELIASGKKTVEVRKTRPKLETPFKCYIYCTTTGDLCYKLKNDGKIRIIKNTLSMVKLFSRAHQPPLNGKVIGEFICKNISEYEAEFHEDDDCYQDIREIFRDDDVSDDECREYRILTSNDDDNPDDCELCKKSCLTFEKIKQYIGFEAWCETFYGWHISDLVIYDKPRELSYFCKPVECPRGLQKEECVGCWDCEIKRPPQSWCYVESEDKNAK